jgi:hypothetical protein
MDKELALKNAIMALKFNQIDWFQFLEIIRNL